MLLFNDMSKGADLILGFVALLILGGCVAGALFGVFLGWLIWGRRKPQPQEAWHR